MNERKKIMSGHISSAIAEARLSRGLSQAELAEAIGVSRPTYTNIESGKKELTISQIKTLSSVLRVSIEDILGDNEILVTANSSFSAEKYKQIILNVLRFGADSDGKITKTKLAKLVYLADFIWYYENSVPMSGAQYRKLPRGPVADIYFRVLDELEEDGMVIREPRGKAIMFSLVEAGQAPVGKLSDRELDLIKKISQAWSGKSTEDIVNFTHEQLPWQICLDGEVIPYSLIFQEEPSKIYGPVEV